ncbi:hypothetical protein Anapl_05864 [Anas platyrhynchos]|uniref:Uncharacterized protein n=1 Tax=Anas platyrhynchos TaxID=8839 RepID=R0KEV2_ANAPL|nr:hypothetical protein Anapl_05864 [Anas platyrhynchos]
MPDSVKFYFSRCMLTSHTMLGSRGSNPDSISQKQAPKFHQAGVGIEKERDGNERGVGNMFQRSIANITGHCIFEKKKKKASKSIMGGSRSSKHTERISTEIIPARSQISILGTCQTSHSANPFLKTGPY